MYLPNVLSKIPSIWVFTASLERLLHSLIHSAVKKQKTNSEYFQFQAESFVQFCLHSYQPALATFYPENLFQSFAILALCVLNNTWVTHTRDQLEVLTLGLLTVSKYCIILREWEETHFLSKASAEGDLLVCVRLHLWHPSGWTSTLFNFLPEQYVAWCGRLLLFIKMCAVFFINFTVVSVSVYYI